MEFKNEYNTSSVWALKWAWLRQRWRCH